MEFKTPIAAWIAGMAALVAGYVLSGMLGIFLAAPPAYATPIFPASGLALAAVLLYGGRYLPGVWLGALLLNLWLGHRLGAGLGPAAVGIATLIASGATLQTWVGMALIRRWVAQPLQLTEVPDIIRFLLLGGPVSCLINPAISVTTLYLAGRISEQTLVFNWWSWWIGDSMGVLMLTPVAFALLGKPRELWRARLRSVALPIGITLTLIIMIFARTNAWEMERIEFTFRERAQRIFGSIDTAFQNQIDNLHSIVQLFISSREVTREEFRSFVGHLLDQHKEIQALEWVPRVVRREAFVAGVRERYADFRITEYRKGKLLTAGQRDVYYPVLYLEPMSANLSAFGYDIGSSADRHAAIDHALQTGRAAITAPVHLVQDRQPRAGLLILDPVMTQTDTPAAGQARTGQLLGFATAVLHVDGLLDSALATWMIPEIAITFEDITGENQPATLYQRHHDDIGTPLFEITRTFSQGGRHFRVSIAAGIGYINRFHAWQSWLILAGGMIFTGLLMSFLLALSGHTARIQHSVNERTRELAEANASIGASNRLLNAITRVQNQYISSVGAGQIFRNLLSDLLSITDSCAGVIGECCDGHHRHLCIQALQPTPATHRPPGLRLTPPLAGPVHGIEALFDLVLERSQAVALDNDRAGPFLHPGDSDGTGPCGRYQIALPIRQGVRITGMIALARDCGPYPVDIADYLAPLLNSCGNLIAGLHSEQARIQSEQALRNREERLRAVLDNAADAIFTLDENGRVETVNPEGLRLLGYGRDELLDREFTELFLHEDRDRLLIQLLEDTDGTPSGPPRPRPLGILNHNGDTIPVMLSISHIRDSGYTLYTAILHDLTEQQRIDRMKNEFISTVSHELRTPLTSIRGSLGLLESGTIADIPDKAKSLIQIADRNAQRLITLINGILDMEKMESGKMRLQREVRPLRPILEQAIEGAQGYADQYRVGIRLDGYPEVEPHLDIDADRFIEVMYNLLSNAIKYSNPDAEVSIAVERLDGRVRIAVHDDGPGIPPQFQDNIFGKFSQADSSTTRSYQGSGLGLSITKSLVELMDGHIDFETSATTGTTFKLDFPLAG